MKTIEIYTDGACSGNPGAGGWAAILCYMGTEKELSGFEPETTNNRMELLAAICALEALKEPCKIKLYSDSSYLVNANTKGWLHAWAKNGWRKADKSPVLNRELWERFLRAAKDHEITFCWVKGHDGHPHNERCDALAVAAIKNGK